ncbi:hypothetical protein Efla_002304 [Eimeria flavescens]
MSFNKLYEKMLVESQQIGSDGQRFFASACRLIACILLAAFHAASKLLKGQDDALDNPQEEDAASKESFYKADEEEMNYFFCLTFLLPSSDVLH